MAVVGRQLVVSAHLDDAVLSCYGALGPESTVVTVLAGMPPSGTMGLWDARGGASDSRERVAERREEDRRALTLSGSELVHLDFPDSQYTGNGGLEPPTVASVAEGLRPLLADAEFVYAPSALSARTLRRLRPRAPSDHRLVRDAVLAVRSDAVLYADLPYARHPTRGGFRLPRELSGVARRRHVVRLGVAAIAEKLRAVERYESQLAQLRAAFGEFIDEKNLGTEVYWAPTELRTIPATRST
jgi:LmbE family N-acetylglucosaminyl deacetylase